MVVKYLSILVFLAFLLTLSLGQEKKINVIVFGAHPDDTDVKAGGMAIKFAELGHNGLFVRKAAHTYNEIKELFPMMK